MGATRCAVIVFKRVHCIPVQTSLGNRMAGKVAEWLSMHKRVIFQSISKNVSPLLKGVV